jgi:hypothetical protein
MKTVKRTLAKAWLYGGKTYGPGDADLPEHVHDALRDKGAFEDVKPVVMSAADPMASAAGPVPPAQLAPLPAPVIMPSINPPAPDLSPTVPVPGVPAATSSASTTTGLNPTPAAPAASGAPSEEAASSVDSTDGASEDGDESDSEPPATETAAADPPAHPTRRAAGRRRTPDGDSSEGEGEE